MKLSLMLFAFIVSNLINAQVDFRAIQSSMLIKVNDYRKTRSLQNLILDPGIQKAAQNQCDYIFKIKNLTHTQPNSPYKTTVNRIQLFSNENYMSYGENCLKTYGQLPAATIQETNGIVDQIFQLWRNSKVHNANLLHARFTHTNFGFRYNPETEEIYCVMDFGGV